jgi:hypothetical protein
MNKPNEHPSGQPVGGQWAAQQKKGMDKQQSAGQPDTKQQGGQQVKESGQQGDERTPDQPIGEVAYANRNPVKKKTGEF